MLEPNGFKPGLRTLVNLLSYGATILIGINEKIPIFSKSQAIKYYQYVHKAWLYEEYRIFHDELEYQIPSTKKLKAKVESIIESVPDFENYVLYQAKNWLD